MNICVDGNRRDDEPDVSGGVEEELWGYEFGGDVLGETFGVVLGDVLDEKYEKRLLPEILLVKPLNDNAYSKK